MSDNRPIVVGGGDYLDVEDTLAAQLVDGCEAGTIVRSKESRRATRPTQLVQREAVVRVLAAVGLRLAAEDRDRAWRPGPPDTR
jgi:hypothetical protein